MITTKVFHKNICHHNLLLNTTSFCQKTLCITKICLSQKMASVNFLSQKSHYGLDYNCKVSNVTLHSNNDNFSPKSYNRLTNQPTNQQLDIYNKLSKKTKLNHLAVFMSPPDSGLRTAVVPSLPDRHRVASGWTLHSRSLYHTISFGRPLPHYKIADQTCKHHQ